MTGDRANHDLNGLWREFTRVIRVVEPRVFVVENVPQFLKSQEFDAFQRVTEDLGYTVVSGVLSALDFGVAQKRRRAIVIGSAAGHPYLPNPASPSQRTVAEVIGALPNPTGIGERLGRGVTVSDMELHFRRNPRPISLERYKLVPPGGNRFDLMRKAPEITPRCWLEKPTGSTDVFGRLRWDEPALTIRTEFFKPEKGRYLHPAQHRPITHLEAALLQDFDREYKWTGPKISVARQIGNAVPPGLAQGVAEAARRILDGEDAVPVGVAVGQARLDLSG